MNSVLLQLSGCRPPAGLLALLAGLVGLPLLSFAEPVAVVTTNYVIVTNVVFVTNYVESANVATAPPSHPKLPDLSWVPPADDFDWIQLKSGEWLKGRLKAMQDRELEFVSEELDTLTFDWKDIRQVRSARELDVLFVSGDMVFGSVAITPERVVVGSSNTTAFARDQLQSLTPGGSKERNYWSGRASLGLSLRGGNTESMEYNASANLQRRTPATRFSLDYLGNVSSVDSVQSANNHRVNSEFNLWLSRRLFLVLPFAEYYRDPFQNLDYRLTLGVGAGFDLVDRPNLEWNITAGPAYQHTVFDSVQPGEDLERGAAAMVFGSRFDWNITRRIELILAYRLQLTSEEVGETTHHSESTLSLELTKRFNLDVSFIWDRVSNPKASADGTQPEPDDYRLVLGVGVDF